MGEEVTNTGKNFEEKLNKMNSEVIWRLKDAEELIKDRISKEHIKSLLAEQNAKTKNEIALFA